MLNVSELCLNKTTIGLNVSVGSAKKKREWKEYKYKEAVCGSLQYQAVVLEC